MTVPLDAETKKLRATPLAQLVDQVGADKAMIAAAEERLETRKQELIRRKVTEASGALFDVTLTPPGERRSLDKDALVADFGAEAVEQRYTKTTIGTSWTLRCVARKQRVRAAA